MIGLLVYNTSLGGNYLLNVGPLPDGRFPAPAIRRLREIGGWMAATILETGQPLVVKTDKDGSQSVELPEQAPDDRVSVIVLEIK